MNVRRELLTKLLLDLAKIIFAIGVYGVFVSEMTNKIFLALISSLMFSVLIITAFSITKKK